MWSALKNDFTELVNVVKEDTGIVLDKVDQPSIYEQEAERRKYVQETYLEPVVPKDEEGTTLDNDELKIIHEFLDNLNLQEKQDDMKELLQDDEEFKEIYDSLVVEQQLVKEEDFWERYYFYCNEEAIEKMWMLQEQRAKESRAALIGNVSNLIGGAAKSIVNNVKHVTETSTGRPPFVMNTAVDEEDDEEEELGWDDEDEDDDDDDNSSRLGSSYVKSPNSGNLSREEESTIEFKDEALEQTKEQLKIVMEERDLLQQTVSLQNKELQNLRGNQTTEDNSSNSNKLLADLQSQLATKEQELKNLQSNFQEAAKDWESSKKTYETSIERIEMDKMKLAQELEATKSENALKIKHLEQQLKDALAGGAVAASKPAEKTTTSPSFSTPKQTETPVATKLDIEDEEDDWGDDWD